MAVDEDRDTNYRGPVDENGNKWDDDFEWYCNDTDISSYRVTKKTDADSEWQCYYVYIGTVNVEVTIGDEKLHRVGKTDQEWYQWLWDNRRVHDLGYDEITRR